VAKLKVAINGFGRIGRIAFRTGFERLDIVGINNIDGDAKALAHLLKYDSTHGRFAGEVRAEGNSLVVNGKTIPISSERDPANVPWKAWGTDIVFECTGAFKKRSDFEKPIQAGAKRMIVSAPAPESDLTVVYGINHTQYDPSKHMILSNASCTTNCLAPLAKVLHEKFGIVKGLMTTIHSYTGDQRLLDATHSDLRRARAATLSMVPTTTGAAKAVGEVLPELKGKIDGTSIRVPTANVSLVDLTVELSQEVTKDSVNDALIQASETTFKGVLAVEEAPLVSIDFNGNPYSSIIDLQSTMVIGGKMVKVFSWYDNETGFSTRMVDLALHMQERGL
jgi:glyceraldehyde 3-phosphate dehydrogenase